MYKLTLDELLQFYTQAKASTALSPLKSLALHRGSNALPPHLSLFREEFYSQEKAEPLQKERVSRQGATEVNS